jgi:hypothetical protein
MNISGNAATSSVDEIRAVQDGLSGLVLAAFEAHLDQVNVGKLIDAFAGSTKTQPGMSGVTVTGCSVMGDRQFVEVEEDEEDDEDDWIDAED